MTEQVTPDNYTAIIDVETARAEIKQRELERASAARQAELKIEADAKIRKAREETKQSRHEMWVWCVGIFAVLAVMLALITWGYLSHANGPNGPSDNQIEQERETQCIGDGGGWVPKDLLISGSSHGLCVFPGKTVTG